MSAIAGIYNLNGRSVKQSDVARMVDVLAHRGPDGRTVWCDNVVGLGHCMLHTTPESLHEELPLVDKTRDLVMTSDARIDNRDELMEALGVNTATNGELSDSQLILSAYVKWGEECVQHLLGDFVFVIWDGQKRTLFCVRDHFGVKPLYYHYVPGKFFAFATEIKALFCLTDVPKRINEARVAEHLLAIYDHKSQTSYETILRLQPAHTLTIGNDEIQLECYYTLDKYRELRLDSDEEYFTKFRKSFTEAVHCRMRSAFRIGCMLSGGLDSSAVTCVARRCQKNDAPLLTISNIFEVVHECDERPFINAVLSTGGFEPHYTHGDQRGFLDKIDHLLWHKDEVLFGPGWFSQTGVYEVGKEQDVRILLDGHGGDETVSYGNAQLQVLARTGKWFRLAKEVKGVFKMYDESWWRPFFALICSCWIAPLIEKLPLLAFIRRVMLSLWWRSVGKRLRPRYKPQLQVPLSRDFIERAGLDKRYRDWHRSEGLVGSEREGHYRDLSRPIISAAFEELDSISAASAIEARYPFYDKRLVEFCLSLPPELKLHEGWSRFVFRQAMEGILPHEIQWRTSKTNFIPNLRRGLLAVGRERLDDLIERSHSLAEYIDLPALREIYHRFKSSKNSGPPEDVLVVWRAASLSCWLKTLKSTSDEGG